MTSTITKVRNYQGNNSFVLKMKQSLEKWGNLTPKQIEVVEKCLSDKPNVNIEELPENLKTIANYEGPNKFVTDIKGKLLSRGTLSDNQINKANEAITREKERRYLKFPKGFPTPGETIKIGRKIGQQLKEKYGLKFNPILIDISKILVITDKAVRFSGKLTIKRGNVCTSCLKTLTDEFSMLTGMGKKCAENFGVTYIKDSSEAERFRNEYMKRVDEIGELEFWIPISKIVKWEGKSEGILDVI